MNRSSRNLRRLDAFLRDFRAPGAQSTLYATNNADATSRLDKLDGCRVVIARPEMRSVPIDEDNSTDNLDTAIFVLEKHLGNGWTEEGENAQYSRLLAVAGDIIDRLGEEMASGRCESLAGMRLTSVSMTPELMLFGGWCGWSIDISISA